MKLTAAIGQARPLAVAAGWRALLSASAEWAVCPSPRGREQQLRATAVYRLARYAEWGAKGFARWAEMVKSWMTAEWRRLGANLAAAKAVGVTRSSRFLSCSRIAGSNHCKER